MKSERKFYQNNFLKDFERLWENLEKDHVTIPIQITTKMMKFLDQMMMNKNHQKTIARFVHSIVKCHQETTASLTYSMT